jgi:hypothetical protein
MNQTESLLSYTVRFGRKWERESWYINGLARAAEKNVKGHHDIDVVDIDSLAITSVRIVHTVYYPHCIRFLKTLYGVDIFCSELLEMMKRFLKI